MSASPSQLSPKFKSYTKLIPLTFIWSELYSDAVSTDLPVHVVLSALKVAQDRNSNLDWQKYKLVFKFSISEMKNGSTNWKNIWTLPRPKNTEVFKIDSGRLIYIS